MNSKDYWSAREAEQLKHYIADEKEYDKQIKQIYENMLDGAQKEIDGFYGRYATKEGISINEAKKRVTKLDMASCERKAARYVKEKDFSKQANEEMRLYNAAMKINRLEMLKANIGIELIAGHDELNRFMGEILKGRTEEELKRQAGILGKTVLNNAERAKAIPNASFHNATYSDRIWMYQDLMKADLSKLLQRGLIQGKNPRVLARELQKYVLGDAKGNGGAKFHTECLMRTELARVQTEAQKQSFERNGFTQYTFIANGGCCDICSRLNGKHFKVKNMLPGENSPPMHPHCRCSVAAYEDSEDYEKWLDYLDKGGTTEEWNRKKKSRESVAKAGKGGIMEMYRKGYTHRRKTQTGSEIIDKATYHKITNPAIKSGADIRIADDEWNKRLIEKDATAVTIGNVIFFRKDASVSDVLEEVHHFNQNKSGLNANQRDRQRMILNEIDAKQYLLSVTEKYRISSDEVELTKKQLESYEKEMEDMKRKGEWID